MRSATNSAGERYYHPVGVATSVRTPGRPTSARNRPLDADSVLAGKDDEVTTRSTAPVTTVVQRTTLAAHSLACVCLAFMFLLILANVVARNVFGTSITGASSIPRYLLVGVVYMGLASAYDHTDGLIRFTLIIDHVRSSTRRLLLGLAGLLTGVALGVLAGRMWMAAADAHERGSVTADDPRIPLYLLYGGAALGLTVVLLAALVHTRAQFRSHDVRRAERPRPTTLHSSRNGGSS